MTTVLNEVLHKLDYFDDDVMIDAPSETRAKSFVTANQTFCESRKSSVATPCYRKNSFPTRPNLS